MKHGTFGNSVHGLCMFHLFIQGYKNHVNARSRNESEEKAYQWIRSWFLKVETMNEQKLSKKRFFEWLQTDDVSKSIPEDTKNKIISIIGNGITLGKTILPSCRRYSMVFL